MPYGRTGGRTSRTPSSQSGEKQLRITQALDNFAHLAKPDNDRLAPFAMRLYRSQINELENMARRIPGVSVSELAREIIEKELVRWR